MNLATTAVLTAGGPSTTAAGGLAEFSGSARAMSLVDFTAVATITLLLCVMTGPDRDDLDEFYTGYGSLSPCATASPSPATTSRRRPCWAPAE